MKLRTTIITFLIVLNVCAQTDIDTLFPGFVDCDFKLAKKDNTGSFYIGSCDSAKIYFWPNNKQSDFRLFDKNYNMLLKGQVVGSICSQLEVKGGKWTSYYPNGKTKTEGYYHGANVRTGTWKHYYPNGQLEKTYTLGFFNYDSCIGTCLAGSYEEYYDNGQLKISGLYNVDCEQDTTYFVTYDSLGNEIEAKELIKVPKSVPSGTWSYYKTNGELMKREYH